MAGGCCWPPSPHPLLRCSFWPWTKRARRRKRPAAHRILMLDQAIFYLFAGVAVVSAILTVTRRNAVHSAIFLITALLATAGIFLELRAEFLFIVQIILYVGG